MNGKNTLQYYQAFLTVTKIGIKNTGMLQYLLYVVSYFTISKPLAEGYKVHFKVFVSRLLHYYSSMKERTGTHIAGVLFH